LVALKFERDVVERESLGQHRPDQGGDLLRLAQGGLAGNDDVSRDSGYVGCEVPQVHVVHVGYLVDGANGGYDLIGIESFGHAFHQDMGGVAQQPPAGVEHQPGSRERSQRVGAHPAQDQDHQAGGQCGR
jgi:hypothetical protein